MQVLFFAVLVGSLAAPMGWSLGRLYRKDPASDVHRSEALGFAALGMIVGMALGLSTVPVLAATFAAGFALIGTLIPVYLAKADPLKPEAPATPRPIPVGVWLFPFATAMALGMILGIALRVNNALDFRDESLREQFVSQGFTEQQATDIMDRLARSIHDVPSTTTVLQSAAAGLAKSYASRVETGLQANESNPGEFDWKGFWDRLNRAKLSEARKLEELKKVAPAPIPDEIMKLEEQSAESILKIIRGKHPEIGG